jgi:hypothetical protein
MSGAGNQPNPYKPNGRGTDDRELFVTTDIRSIPVRELLPMCGGVVQWLTAVLAFKIFRAKSDVTFACESRRLVRVEPEQISRRIMRHFDELRPRIADLGFHLNYYASMPAIGRIAAAVMTMSRADGKIHFFAVRVALQTDNQVNDDGHFGFGSPVSGGGSLVTVSPAKLPTARHGINRLIVGSHDPITVLETHRGRIRDVAIRSVSPRDLFEHAEQETRLEADDLLARRIIRPATAAEVGRIRVESRV